MGGADMTNTNNDWPDKPGVPLNPEQEGQHWLRYEHDGYVEVSAFLWERDGYWVKSRHVHYSEWPGRWTYLGPVLPHDEVQNLRDDLASAERERAHQHGRADRNAAEYAREQGKREALQAREEAMLEEKAQARAELRDRFAGYALIGLLAAGENCAQVYNRDEIAIEAWKQADAMMKAHAALEGKKDE